MRKILVLVAAASFIALPGAFAQAQQKPQHERRQARAENMVEHHLHYLTTVLSLSMEQQAQAKTILMNTANEDKPLFADVRAERRDLQSAVLKEEPASAMQQLSDKIGSDVSKLAMNNASASEQMYKILNPEQKAKPTQLQNERHGRFGAGWRANG